jgi:hypothetical protein
MKGAGKKIRTVNKPPNNPPMKTLVLGFEILWTTIAPIHPNTPPTIGVIKHR